MPVIAARNLSVFRELPSLDLSLNAALKIPCSFLSSFLLNLPSFILVPHLPTLQRCWLGNPPLKRWQEGFDHKWHFGKNIDKSILCKIMVSLSNTCWSWIIIKIWSNPFFSLSLTHPKECNFFILFSMPKRSLPKWSRYCKRTASFAPGFELTAPTKLVKGRSRPWCPPVEVLL